MKRIKRMFSVILAMAMTLAMCSSVFAASTGATDATKDNYTITITGKTAGHTYSAYQVFKGKLAEKDGKLILSNIEWGDGVQKTDALVTELASKIPGIEVGMSASQVADVLKNLKDDAENLQEFADIIGQVEYLNAAKAASKEGDNFQYTIEVDEAGYYFIKDTGAIGETATATDYILEVVGDASVNTKDDVVSLDKKIVSGNEYVSSNKAGIGDNVTYRLSAKVPDHTAYKQYYFIMNDKLSDGLTFNNDVVVTIGNETIGYKTLTRGKDYYIYEGDNDNLLAEGVKANAQSFKIAFADIKEYTKELDIFVTYSAKLNDNAVIGENGNTNTANLTYSNDPNFDGSGMGEDEKPGLPDSSKKVPTGETPKIDVVTFTTQVEIFKTQDGPNNALAGAEFTLTGISRETVLKSGDKYTQSADGTWYLLNDGTYTETAPQETVKMEEAEEGATAGYVVAEEGYEGNDIEVVDDIRYRPFRAGDTGTVYIKIEPNDTDYVSTTVKFTKETATENTVTEKYVKMVAISDAKGQIIFKGLGEGEFTITETKTPDGFNTALPIKVVITGTVSGTGKAATCAWSTTGSSDGVRVKALADSDHKDDIEDEYYVNIVNNSGSILPSTGGIGTTIFYIIGGILVVGAAILLVTKKRMSREV